MPVGLDEARERLAAAGVDRDGERVMQAACRPDYQVDVLGVHLQSLH